MTFLVFVLALGFAGASVNADGPLVIIENGPVGGFVADNGVEKFFGIPFAEPPVGELRFEAPVPFSANWTGTRDGTKLRNSCYQKVIEDFNMHNTPLSEDCLYLNVYRPGGAAEKLAVMVWFHGGGYTTGTANAYNPSPLVKGGNVIVVTANYRLSALGFFYQEGKPSATGIQDQQLALRWVQSNIGYFGGDPAKVTIFGESAGSGSVAHHFMSPTSKGLFQRGILQSGTLGAPWASTSVGVAKRSAMRLAQALGCSRNETVDISCMKEAAVEDIVQSMTEGFGPTPDGEVIAADPFKLSDRIPSNDADALIGFTTSEGFMSFFFTEPKLPALTANYSDLSFLEDSANVADILLSLLANQFIGFKLGNRSVEHLATTYEYIRDANTPLERLKALDAACSDVHFRHGGVNFAAKLANEGHGNIYFYEFDHKFTFDILGPPDQLYHGVGHGADLIDLIFRPVGAKLQFQLGAMFDFERDGGGVQTGVFGSDILLREQDEPVRQRVVKYWTDFAKTGNPGNPFRKYNSDKRNYVHIGTESDQERENYMGSYYNFWEKYMPKLSEFGLFTLET